LGRSGFLKADDGRKHAKDEQENPHGNLQSRSGLSRQNSKISGSQTQIAIQVFYSRFATRRGYCGQYRRSCRSFPGSWNQISVAKLMVLLRPQSTQERNCSGRSQPFSRSFELGYFDFGFRS
jgi:hypothetical protein